MPTIKIPALHGGVSRQPAQLRFPEQVDESINVVHSVAKGGGIKRAGTTLERVVTGADGTERLHPIDRSDSEQWLLIYRAGSIRAMPASSSGVEGVVHKLSTSRLYLAGATADQLRLLTIADTTIIANNQKATGLQDQESLPDAVEVPKARDVFAATPAERSIYRAKTDDEIASAGFWQYAPGASTFATLTFPTTYTAPWNTATDANGYLSAGKQHCGFRVFFGTFYVTDTTASWNAASRQLTLSGAQLATYTHADGEYVNITAAGTPGWYKIARRISASVIELPDTSFSAVNQVNVHVDGIGIPGNVAVDFAAESVADMYDVAAVFQRALQSATGQQPLCSWTATNNGTTSGGYMTITHLRSGASAFFPTTNAVKGPLGSTYDLTNNAGEPFYAVGVVGYGNSGSGTTPTTVRPVEDRWEQIAAPSQAGALLDASKMQQRITREHRGGTIDWNTLQAGFKPAFGWRLNEAASVFTLGPAFGDQSAECVTATPGNAGPAAISGSGAVQIGVNGAIDLGKLKGWGSSLGRGFSIRTGMKTSSATRATIFAMGNAATGAGLELQLQFNTANGSTNTANSLWFHLSDTAGNRLVANVASSVTFNNGNFHRILVAVDPASNAVAVWVDGTAQTVNVTVSGTPSSFRDQNDSEPAAIGGWYSGGSTTPGNSANGTQFTEFYLDQAVFESAAATMDASRFANSGYSAPSLFTVSPIDWTPRLSGDSTLNPAPLIFREGHKINAMAFGVERFFAGGGPGIGGSQTSDLYNFFASDADNPVDSDPINAPVQDEAVSTVTDIVPLQRVMVILTSSPLQLELAFDGPSSAQRITLTPTTRYQTIDIRPSAMNTAVYYCISRPNGAHLIEVLYDGDSAQVNPYDVAEHADSYIPSSLKTNRAHNNTGQVFLLPTDGSAIYVYRSFWSGNSREQSAWGKWTIAGGCTVVDMAVIRDALWLLVKQGGLYTLESLPVEPGPAASGWPFALRMDRQITLTGGIYNGGTNKTSWTIAVTDTTLDTVRVGPAFADSGAKLTPTILGTTVSVTGDYSAGSLVIGRVYPQTRLDLSEQFLRDQNRQAITNMRVTHREVVVSHTEAGSYQLLGRMTNRPDRVKQFAAPAGTVAGSGQTRGFITGDAASLRLSLISTDDLPCTWTSIEMNVDADERSLR